MCIVRELTEVTAIDDQQLHNEYDCPLLTMTNELHIMRTSSILTAASIMHEYSTSCTFLQTADALSRERETVTVSTHTYKHDYNNKIFCQNVYAMQ